jgi:predicted DNA-binding transcriptional regulator YafY
MEIEALALGMAEVKRMGDPALEAAATSVLAKIAATLPDGAEQHLFHAISQVYRPEARYAASLDLDTIRGACWREQALSIRYANQGHAVTERTILPLAIVYTDRTLTVLAWCCLREAFRMFRPERIIDLQATGKSFRPQRAALLRTYLAELTNRDPEGTGIHARRAPARDSGAA